MRSFAAGNSIELIDGGAGVNLIAGTGGYDSIDLSATTFTHIDRTEAGAGTDTVTGNARDEIVVGARVAMSSTALAVMTFSSWRVITAPTTLHRSISWSRRWWRSLPRAVGELDLSPELQSQLEPVLAANWHQEAVGLGADLLRRWESAPFSRSFSSNSYGYSPQTIEKMASPSHLARYDRPSPTAS